VTRAHKLLAALLAVQVILLVIARGPWAGNRGRTESGPLLPELESVTAQKIEIEDADGKSVVLEREGQAWALETQGGYPADTSRVRQLLTDLAAARKGRPVVSSGRYHKALKVADGAFERRVRLWDGTDRSPRVELYVGTSPSYQASNVRRGGDDRVFEASGINAFDLSAAPDAWVDRNLVSVSSGDVTAIEVKNRGGRFALEKRDGVWKVTQPAARAGRTADSDKVMEFLRPLAPLSLESPVGAREPAQGLDDPAAMVVLKTGGPVASAAEANPAAKVVTLLVGAEKADTGGRFVSTDGFGYTATIVKSTADRILDQKLGDLLR
jgi:hypothetical protein